MAAGTIDRFVGTWIGAGVTEDVGAVPGQGVVDRQLEVRIAASEDGFRITWMTARRAMKKGASQIKYWATSVNFAETGRPGIFESEVREDLARGRPYRWAVLSDNAIIVHSVAIVQDGRLEHQKYIRTLLGTAEMQLRYTRILDGVTVRSVIGLVRKK
jgi:hypothetical protein